MLFFSNAYLYVNHDQAQFTIWQTKRDAQHGAITGVDTANNCIGLVRESNPSNPNPIDPGNGGSTGPGQGGNKKVSTGAIAGAVVGGVLGLIVIAFGIWFFWHRKKRSDNRQSLMADMSSATPDQSETIKYAHADNEGNAELDAHGTQTYPELAGPQVPIELPSNPRTTS